jgi:hypothetical protein
MVFSWNPQARNLKKEGNVASDPRQDDYKGSAELHDVLHGTQGRIFGARKGLENDPGYRSSSDAEDGFEDGFE